MSGSTGMRVLHVDDEPDFADLTATYLEREEDELAVETATSAEEGLDRLAQTEIDCIVSDYDMPGKNGIDFLEAVREDYPDLPFILFTGKGSEEVASEAISAGVSDYLRKESGTDQYTLLANRIRNYVQKYRVADEFDRMERQYEKIVEQNLAGIYIIQDGEFVYVNPRLAEMHGYDRREVIGRSPMDLVAPAERSKVERNIERRLKGEIEKKHYEVRGLRKNGEEIQLELYGSRIQLDGDPAIIGLALDVTERVERKKDLRETVKTYESLFDSVNDAVFIHEPEGNFLAVNQTACDRLGYSEEELLELTPYDIDAGEHAERTQERIDVISEEKVHTFESVHETKSGETIPVEVSASYIEYFGEDAILSVARDSSNRVERERELRKMKRAVDASGHAIYVTDVDGTIEYVNPAFENITGFDKSEAIGRTPAILHSGEMAEEYYERLWETILDNQVWEEEIVNRDKAGELYLAHQTIAPISQEESDIEGFVAIQTDITEGEEVERELTTLVDNLPGIVYRCKEEPGWPMEVVRGESAELTGYTAERLERGEVSYGEDIVHPEDTERVWDAVTNAIEEGKPFAITYRIQTQSGELKWVWEKGRLVKPIGKDETRLEGFITDITERREQKQRLERFKQAIEASSDLLTALDSEYRFYFANQRYCEFHGVADGNGISGRTLDEVHPPDTKVTIREYVDQALEGERVEYKMRRAGPSGDKRTFSIRYDPIEGDAGEIEGVACALRDITDLERHERRLEKRDKMLRNLHSRAMKLIGTDSRMQVFQLLAEGMGEIFRYDGFSIMKYDTEGGLLSSIIPPERFEEQYKSLPDIKPGENPLWEVYRQGTAKTVTLSEQNPVRQTLTGRVSSLYVTPLGDYGLIVIAGSDNGDFDEQNTELVELLARYGEAILDRIERNRSLDEVSNQLAEERARSDNLQDFIRAIRTIRQEIANKDTRRSIERTVCDELVSTDLVDFAFVARPGIPEWDLSIDAWSGEGRGYIDTVEWESDANPCPSQKAASSRGEMVISHLNERLFGQNWAKEAVTRGFKSVISVPLMQGDVLHGVLTAFSKEPAAFEGQEGDLIRDISSLMVTYFNILNIRHASSNLRSREIEFEIRDTNCVVYNMAKVLDSRIELVTVLEEAEETIRLLLRIHDDNSALGISRLNDLAHVDSAKQYGHEEANQIVVSITKPFLGSVVSRHGGTLVGAEASPEVATVTILIPETVSVRPLVEALTSLYKDIELVARRSTPEHDAYGVPTLEGILTDRQVEIIQAAFYGGYYDSPRGITGEELGEEFGISNTAVHRHIRNAHRSLLLSVLNIETENGGLSN